MLQKKVTVVSYFPSIQCLFHRDMVKFRGIKTNISRASVKVIMMIMIVVVVRVNI